MRGTMWLIALGCGIMLSSSGCCGFLQNGGCGRGCGCESCGACEGDCGPAHRPYRPRAYAEEPGGCSTCGDGVARGGCSTCGECGDDCGNCCQRNFCVHPFRWIGRIFTVGTWCGPSCGNGCCGEAPEGCAKCSHCGRPIGHGGCASCNHGGEYEGSDMTPAMEGESMQTEPAMVPTPAGKPPTNATRRVPANSYDR